MLVLLSLKHGSAHSLAHPWSPLAGPSAVQQTGPCQPVPPGHPVRDRTAAMAPTPRSGSGHRRCSGPASTSAAAPTLARPSRRDRTAAAVPNQVGPTLRRWTDSHRLHGGPYPRPATPSGTGRPLRSPPRSGQRRCDGPISITSTAAPTLSIHLRRPLLVRTCLALAGGAPHLSAPLARVSAAPSLPPRPLVSRVLKVRALV